MHAEWNLSKESKTAVKDFYQVKNNSEKQPKTV